MKKLTLWLFFFNSIQFIPYSKRSEVLGRQVIISKILFFCFNRGSFDNLDRVFWVLVLWNGDFVFKLCVNQIAYRTIFIFFSIPLTWIKSQALSPHKRPPPGITVGTTHLIVSFSPCFLLTHSSYYQNSSNLTQLSTIHFTTLSLSKFYVFCP